MPGDEREPSDADNILKALGELALAASQAESYAAQGIYYLLADKPGDAEGAARISGEFRSFDSLHRLLCIALRCETPLGEILHIAKTEASRDAGGEPLLVAAVARVAATAADREYLSNYVSAFPRATPAEYLNRVKALYDRRNECLHALGLETVGREVHLHKRKKDGTRSVINARFLTEPCIWIPHYPEMTLAGAIEAVALELSMASLSLVVLPITVQWFRRRGTPLDYAPLVDHYVSLAVKPLEDQIELLKKAEATLEAKLRASKPSE